MTAKELILLLLIVNCNDGQGACELDIPTLSFMTEMSQEEISMLLNKLEKEDFFGYAWRTPEDRVIVPTRRTPIILSHYNNEKVLIDYYTEILFNRNK
jgi:hypothetical protein